MGNAPGGIDRVAMKAAADVVAHPAEADRSKRAQRHVARLVIADPRMLAEEEQQLRAPRKFLRVAEPAVTSIEAFAKLRHGTRARPGLRHARPDLPPLE